jgi:uncharacterized protein YjiS (DUF1127 family)
MATRARPRLPSIHLPARLLVPMLARRLARWYELHRQRRLLLSLDDRLLRDIGISRADARKEALRPFWHDPWSRP